MKVICTEKEKKQLVKALTAGPLCPFRHCPTIPCEMDCIDCIKTNIEWKIEMKNKIPLEPCPFCGSTEVYLSNWTDQAYVACTECGARTEVFLHAHCAEQAAAAWNQRADRAKVVVPMGDN